MSSIADAVVFDWDGSLTLARHLWSFADQLDRLATERRTQADAALVDWSGAFAVRFEVSIDAEMATLGTLTSALRAEANGWAIEWQKAMDQENRNRFQAACKRVRDERSNMDKLGGLVFGHDDLPPDPGAARMPWAPCFPATRQFADYSNY